MDTLVLDASYRAINKVSWRRAFKLLISNRVEVVHNYPNRKVRTGKQELSVPSVIRFPNTHCQWRRNKVKFSPEGIFIRDKGTCQYCGKKVARGEFELEHVVPSTRGGQTSWENIVASCKSCNRRKANRTPEEAGMKLLSRPRMPTVAEFDKAVMALQSIPEEWTEFL